MFLKSLTMKGFKSFADPTVLEFEPGITVVVGPNGSGKSNVVDAVTWVLGAQGPRSLRSQKMEDVIFAGTSSRPALGRAEVSLTIDNASGRLAVDMAEVTITRVLFRTGESEYAINGLPCRLLDVQELLSDSGVGRQQHMIIGQGQLDSVLSARPEDRRTVIEEAAGVLKHRRRKERAERRLAAAQESLERLGDLVREIRRQIRPLERQAAAARQHATMERELRTIRLHLAGQELAALAARHESVTGALRGDEEREAAARRDLATLEEEASTATAELASQRQGDLADMLGAAEGLSERARGLGALLRERGRSLAASLEAAFDTDVVSTLEADASRLGSQLAAGDQEAATLQPRLEAADARHEEARRALATVRAGHEQSPDAGEARAALEAARSRSQLLERTRRQQAEVLESSTARLAALESRQEELRSSIRHVEEQRAGAGAVAGELEAAAEEAAGAAAASVERFERAEAERATAEEARHRASARADALERALSDLEGEADRGVVAGSSGLVGVLAELVDVDPGYEGAFVAAGAPASALVVRGVTEARDVLARLAAAGSGGAVVAVPEASGAPGADRPVPPGAELVRDHVRARPGSGMPGLDRALDRLLADALCVSDWRQAIDLAVADPTRIVVTLAGDRFSGQGWRVRSGSPVVTRSTVDRARHEAAAAGATADRATAVAAAARRDREAAEQGAVQAERALTTHRHEVDRVVDQAVRLDAELRRAVEEARSAGVAVARSAEAHRESSTELADLESALPRLEADALRVSEHAARRRQEIEVAERSVAQAASAHNELEKELAAASERRRVLAARLAEVERRLAGHAEERQVAAQRRERLEADARAVQRLEQVAATAGEELTGLHAQIRAAHTRQLEALRAGGQHLDRLARRRAEVTTELTALAAARQQHEIELSEVSMRARSVAETVEGTLSSDPETALHTACPELPDGVAPEAHAASLAERLAALGPVNPLALDELSELEERHQELTGQVEDVQSARRELHQVIRHLDEEIMATFTAAVSDVNEHFSTLVATLFPGGTGRLELTDPDDLLHTGVEVEVRPPGRNVRRVSLLSGGERSLVALAFLFAVFRSRPSPFYLMDEVEAALDDVNLLRFLTLLREFLGAEAQLIVVSHQKRTMETADALYGVTMAPGGSSQVLSQKVDRPRSSDPADAAADASGVLTPIAH